MPPHSHGRPAGVPRHDRRRVLLAGGALVGTALAGCTGGPAAPEPVSLASGQACDVCGMVVEKHPGPNGQLFFRDERPRGHDNPARFDSLKQCLFPFRFEHEARGWTVTAAYVTDYSAVDYTVQAEGDAAYISSHVTPGSFAPAADLTYLVGSDLQGAMGPDLLPFSRRADAEALAADYGGELVGLGDIDGGLVGR